MELIFLGTGAGLPSKQRNVTSIALTWYEERGGFWLFDCGEGTQHQILHSPLRLSKLEKLFLTHLHGDHLFGLPGLLGSRSFQGGTELLTIYGPPGIQSFVETVLRISQTHLTYPLEIVEIEEGLVFSDTHVAVETVRLTHGIASYGYRIQERDRPGSLQKEKLEQLGLSPGPDYARLKRGESLLLADGRVVDGNDFVDAPHKGRSVVILGDTRKCEAAVKLARNADVLVHEATYRDAERDRAIRYHHSTSVEAAEVAQEAGVGRLIVTHISARYQGEPLLRLLEEAQAIFPNTELASDFSQFSVGNSRNGQGNTQAE
ncbi:MAG: ribonuclease Z [Alicyclobacillus sp. RIFOXYA1_FULL_53_8]|nr:MAG: ribonuclease Z [Alicyclobacillus sp. RIFOXYA1_FULL_53_8]